MSKPEEIDFFKSLKLIAILLIKHGSPAYRDLMPLVNAYDDHSWHSLPPQEKLHRLQAIKVLTEETSGLTRHFKEFPHKWTQSKYQMLLQSLHFYCETLK